MSRQIVSAALVLAGVSALPVSSAEAGHCCCRSGYSIGELVAPTPVAVHRGATVYRTSPRAVFYDWPSAYDYGYRLPYGYRPYSFYRPSSGAGITISIGTSYGAGPFYRSPYGYPYTGYGPVPGYPPRYGIGRRSGLYFSFGSSLGRHRRHHRHH